MSFDLQNAFEYEVQDLKGRAVRRWSYHDKKSGILH